MSASSDMSLSDDRPSAAGLWPRFRDLLKREELSFWRARFRDPHIEADYIDHLVKNELPKERNVDIAGIALYFAYGALDILTITANLDLALLLRWGVAVPLAAALISLTYIDTFKRYFGYITIAIMFIFANAITGIILVMHADSAPPYLIGIFYVFIFCSCVQRMDFLTATSAYVLTAAFYITAILAKDTMGREATISGIAFMLSFVVIAAGTSYVQEVRSRRIWRRDMQRAEDAAFIERLLIEATAADRSKNNFLSVVTHELRTPLHQIIGFSEVLRDAENCESDRSDEYLDAIRSAAQQLLARIAKILRYSDATAGKIRYQIESAPIADVIDAVAYDFAEKAARAGVTLDAAGVAAADIDIDPNHTRYALANLVENAIAATPKGGRVTIKGEMPADGGYQITISDNGRGMTEGQIDSALRPFTQSEDARTRTMEGIGLGLTLAHRILADQGAELVVDSKVGAGTTISIRFASTRNAGGDQEQASIPASV